MNDIQLKKIGTKVFCEVFKSMQLLGFGILYYNFNFGEDDLIWFNKAVHEYNSICLDDFDNFENDVTKIENITGWDIRQKVKEFPYRARVGMMGGLPKRKGSYGMQAFNMANLESFSAIESYMVLSLAVLIKNKKWGKTQCELWWSNMKGESNNYSNGMKDEFLVTYLFDQIGVQLVEG